ncbi:MAG: hypothetical protein V3R77_05260 [Candidatus Binatia bacterium]
MRYLDFDLLDSLNTEAFRGNRPFPFANPQGALTEEAFVHLMKRLPDPELFTREIGVQRSHGQAPHDRLALEYRGDLAVAPCWHEFVRELRGPRYGRFLKRLFGRRPMALTFHWHYTPDGCSVSPHCDVKRKLGSHLFYFNTSQDWDESWGGQTVALDDGGRFAYKSAPQFEDFDHAVESKTLDNRSFLFARTAGSWHGVRAIHCPEGAYRRVFIVVIEDKVRSLIHAVTDPLQGKKRARY